MSFKPVVKADSTGQWYSNALRFATREEAEAEVNDLSSRWMSVYATDVQESEDPVTHKWVNGKGSERIVP